MPIRSIFVLDQAGRFSDENGSSKGISNPADLAHLKAQRQWADCVATSGRTARIEHYRPLKEKTLVVFTHSNETTFELLNESETVAFLEYSGADSLRNLETQHGNVLVEFGPSLLREALGDNAIDEIIVSITGNSTTFNEEILSELPFDVDGFQRVSLTVRPTLVLASFIRFWPA